MQQLESYVWFSEEYMMKGAEMTPSGLLEETTSDTWHKKVFFFFLSFLQVNKRAGRGDRNKRKISSLIEENTLTTCLNEDLQC